MPTKNFKIVFEITISHDDKSKDLTISGNKVYEALSAEKAEEKATEDWENGDMIHLKKIIQEADTYFPL